MITEKLSQLLDSDLDGQEMEDAIDALLVDEALQQSWNSIHSLRAFAQETDILAGNKILNRVSAALELEEEILAPYNIELEDSGDKSSLQSGRSVPTDNKRTNTIKFLALAASVAAISFVVYQPSETTEPSTIETANFSPTEQMDIEQEMQSMIVQHGEFSSVAALNGLVSYAKVVNDSVSERAEQ